MLLARRGQLLAVFFLIFALVVVCVLGVYGNGWFAAFGAGGLAARVRSAAARRGRADKPLPAKGQ